MTAYIINGIQKVATGSHQPTSMTSSIIAHVRITDNSNQNTRN
nr:MAG TPA: hypothetical protein [Caudoviricetes sp.]